MTEATSRPISRRTVAKGAAWTAPVILGGVAAPAYAASGGKPTIVGGGMCKLPGGSCSPDIKGYVTNYTVTNLSHNDLWLYTDALLAPFTYGPTITSTGELGLSYAGAYIGAAFYAPGTSVPVAKNSSVTIQLYAERTDSSNQKDFTYTVKFQWGHNVTAGVDTDHTSDPSSAAIFVKSTPPCNNCAP